MRFRKAAIVVLDGVGCGGAPDAAAFGDEGSDTLGNTAAVVGGLALPNFAALGLGNAAVVRGVEPVEAPRASWGRLRESAPGKDTTTGHWEISGVVLESPLPTYPGGFPADVLAAFERIAGEPALGNVPASGTAIIEELGEEHQRTGRLIVYTSADSVFQIAAHEETVPLEELYRICREMRTVLTGEHEVGRVIARPFVGRPGAYERTNHRRDFSRDGRCGQQADSSVNLDRPLNRLGVVELHHVPDANAVRRKRFINF